MSIPQSGGGPIGSRDDLVAYVASGAKPRSAWRLGTEHEKFGYRLSDHAPLPYDDPEGGPSIARMFEGLMRFGWEPVREGDAIIGLVQDGANVSLEPGGQLELSGAPLRSVHQTCAEVNTHLDQVRSVAREIGAGFIGLGFTPLATMADTPIMPKGRYAIMRRYMARVGGLGLEMMFRTCTVQVNLDYGSEQDMVRKFRVALALQPVATALFANSPFREGRPNGFLTYRSHIWTDVDAARTGMLPFVFEDGFGFERWVDYALDVPMYFLYRDGRYIDCTGYSFRDFLDGRAEPARGHTPVLSDWADHLTTIFPEVRLKRFLEMRGADAGPWGRICALPALWAGLLYDSTALSAAWDLVKGWSADERLAMRLCVPVMGLSAPTPAGPMRDLARRVLEIADAGLARRAREDQIGSTEAGFLTPLHDIVARGETQAGELLRRYRTEWGGDAAKVFAGYSY